jgi:hypothetical protein
MKSTFFILFTFLCGTASFLHSQEKNESLKDSTLSPIHQFDDVVIIGALEKKEIIPVQTLSGETLKKLNVYSVADAVRYFSGERAPAAETGTGGLPAPTVDTSRSRRVC